MAPLAHAYYDFTVPWKNTPYPVLLQHGIGRSGRIWYEWVPQLAGRWPVVVPDLPGMGLTPPDASGAGLDVFASRQIELLDHLEVEKVHYCGESLGGILGILLASEFPERIETITLVSTPTRFTARSMAAIACGYPSLDVAIEELGPANWADKFNDKRFGADDETGMANWYRDQIGGADKDTLVQIAKELGTADTAPNLTRIRCRSLAIFPSMSILVDEADQERMLQLLQPDESIVIESGGHAIVNSASSECCSAFKRFLEHSRQSAKV